MGNNLPLVADDQTDRHPQNNLPFRKIRRFERGEGTLPTNPRFVQGSRWMI